MNPDWRPGSGARNAGSPLNAGSMSACDPPLADRGQVGERDREQVERGGHRRAVEVSRRDDPFALRRLGEHERVVGDRVDLDLEHPATWASPSRAAPWTWGMQRSEYASWTLAALRVALRDPARVPEKRPQPRSRYALAGVGAGVVDGRAERRARAPHRLQRHRAGDFRGLDQPLRAE